jgi:hypothetical protein
MATIGDVINAYYTYHKTVKEFLKTASEEERKIFNEFLTNDIYKWLKEALKDEGE